MNTRHNVCVWLLGTLALPQPADPQAVMDAFAAHLRAHGWRPWDGDALLPVRCYWSNRYTASTASDRCDVAEVRPPAFVPDEHASVWHQDRTPAAHSHYVAIWSNLASTEIMSIRSARGRGRIVQPAPPGQVVVLDNRQMLHRTPPEISGERWFTRMYVEPMVEAYP